MIYKKLLAALAALAFVALAATPGYAQATRTWVSGVGDDVNPCSRTAPCKTFAGAISKTAPGGEISVLDPGGFGAVTITKSISIVADGDLGSIINPTVNGITVNAGATGVVRIEGLEIEGGGAGGLAGLRILSADSVVVDRVRIHNQNGAATSPGVLVQPSASAARLFMTNSTISHSKVGIKVDGTLQSARVVLDNVELTRNSVTGLDATGASANVTLSNSTITQNTTGIATSASAQVVSMGNNVILANGSNGAPTSTSPLQ